MMGMSLNEQGDELRDAGIIGCSSDHRAVVVTGAGDEVEGLGGRDGAEDGSAEFNGDDVVLLAVDDEDRRPNLLEYAPYLALCHVPLNPLVDLPPDRALSHPQIELSLEPKPQLGKDKRWKGQKVSGTFKSCR
jgi:hypothetical protein